MQLSCLMLIHWEKEYRGLEKVRMRDANGAEKNAMRLLRAWRYHEAPIIHICQNAVDEAYVINPKQEGQEFKGSLEPSPGESVYVSPLSSSFTNTTLEKDLRSIGCNDIVLTGVATDHDISSTARVGSDLGFNVTVVSDACFTFDRRTRSEWLMPAETVHNVHLVSLREKYCQVRSTVETLALFEY